MATAFRRHPLAKPDIIGIFPLRSRFFVKVMMCSHGEDEGNPALTIPPIPFPSQSPPPPIEARAEGAGERSRDTQRRSATRL
ncbi:uncharacterized [Tachysurus ichikawai]